MTLRFKKIEKQDPSISYTGAWTGLSGGSEIQLESPGTESYGYGVLRNNILANATGSSGVALVQGTDFQYDSYIDDATVKDIYDDSSSGSLASGASIRIVENGKNITDDTGLNLRIRAKNLNTIITPPATECYIDPLTGKFVLPRPVYWNRFNSIADRLSPVLGDVDIREFSATTSYCNWNSPHTMKFDKTGVRSVIYLGSGDANLRFRINNLRTKDKGTLSAWVGHYYINTVYHVQRWWLVFNSTATSRVGLSSYSPVGNGGYGECVISGSNYCASSSPFTWDSSQIIHLYIVWNNEGLSDGKNIKIFINGIQHHSVTASFDFDSDSFVPIFYLDNSTSGGGTNTNSQSWLQNLKIWDHVVSEDPSFEYNGGTGKEDALHPIYGATNGYKPYNLKLGYKYLASSTTPATCPALGANEAITLETASNISYGIGQFGASLTSIKKISTYTEMIENTDYVYGKRLDASTTEDSVDGFGTTAGGVVDTGNSGALTKNFRIVENAVNIKGTLGLKVYAKDLSTLVPPPADRIYVDPKRSKFVLPRPVYWNRTLSVSNVINNNAEINCLDSNIVRNITTGFTESISSYSPKFGNGYSIHNWEAGASSRFRLNFPTLLNSKGSFSAWTYGYRTDINQYIFSLFCFQRASSGIVAQGSNTFTVISKYNSVDYQTTAWSWSDIWHHLYFVWNKDGIGSTGYTVRLYIDGVLRHSYNYTEWDTTGTYNYFEMYALASYGGSCVIGVSNIQLWNDAIDDPSWIYNSGTGREDALHPIYGATNGYKPYNLQVGYHKAGGDGVFSKWSI